MRAAARHNGGQEELTLASDALRHSGAALLAPGLWRLGRGEGSPVLLLPGMEGTSAVFARQGPLGARRRVLALDLPVGPDRLAGLAEACLAQVEPALAGQRFSVVGLSLGGLVARAMAERAPDRVRAVVALGSLPDRSLLPPAIRRGRRLAAWLPEPLFSLQYARRIAARLEEEGVAPAQVEGVLAGLPDRQTVLARLDAVLAWGLARALPVPTLWLRGQLDREAPWGATEVLRLLPGAAFATVPGGHRAPLTQPEGFHAAVLAFLEGRR